MISVPDRLFEAHLTVSNLDASLMFYCGQVGFDLAYVLPGRQAAFLWIGGRGRTMLGLWVTADSEWMRSHLAFAVSVDDVLAAPEALRSTGVTPLDFNGHPTNEPVVLAWMPAASVYFRDPDGHLLEYIAMLPDAPRPLDGVLGWREWGATPTDATTHARPEHSGFAGS
jgi:lactoylglutathione lyase